MQYNSSQISLKLKGTFEKNQIDKIKPIVICGEYD